MVDWKYDWQSFVRSVVSERELGRTDLELSRKFGNTEVEWIGTVREVGSTPESARLSLVMPLVWIVRDGQTPFIANHLSIPLRDFAGPMPHEGDHVRFTTRIDTQLAGKWLGVKWYEGERHDSIQLMCKNGRIVDLFSIPRD